MNPDLQALYDTVLPLAQRLHAAGDLAPHGAVLTAAGAVRGSALVPDDALAMDVDQAMQHLEAGFRRAAAAREVVACALFFHAHAAPEAVRTARTEGEANALAASLEDHHGQALLVVVPYRMGAEGIAYEPPIVIERSPRVFAPLRAS